MEHESLVPVKSPLKLSDGDGGSYYAWNAAVFPFLAAAQVSGGMLIMNQRGFAFPHFANSSKIGYVIQGSDGLAGIINPGDKEEKLVKLKKGVAIVVPIGAVSWWFNAGNDQLKIIFLGETANATTNPGAFTYCFLAGAIGILKGFSPKTISKAYDISEEQVNELTTTQKQPLITVLEDGKTMPKPSNDNEHHTNLTCEFDTIKPEISIKNGGSISIMTSEKHNSLEGIQLSGRFLKLEPNAMFGPTYYARDSGIELTYVINGSGWVQVVGMNGQIALDAKLEAGQLFAVPKFYVVAIGAGEQGIECFSIVTTSRPVLGQIAGNTSIWKGISPQVVEASFNVSPELTKLFMDNINNTTIISPPN